MADPKERVLAQVEAAGEEMVAFAADLVRIPSINPPGEEYRAAAEFIGRRLSACTMDVEYFEASHHTAHTAEHPRVNVVGALPGSIDGPAFHLNGHFDVVPPGDGWTVDPFGGVIADGKLYGRGSADMKAGLAAALFAVEAISRAGIHRAGPLEISGTVDEESGGQAGVAHLCEIGRLSAVRTAHVVIPEPFGVDRVCLGHRGVYWFRVTARGRMAHGSMPFLGVNAIDRMQTVLRAFRERLAPRLEERITTMPVVPEGARRATINVNAVEGGQTGAGMQTPCVPDRCAATFDRRFLPEESLEDVKAEIRELLADVAEPDGSYDLEDLLVVEPTATPAESPLVQSFQRAIRDVVGGRADVVASPGTYDHKHVTRLGGIESCVAYGPGALEQAHQPDEWCAVDDIVTSSKVMACAIMDLWSESSSR